MKIIDYTAQDIRFPTSQSLAGSDAMNAAPDYSAAYVILHTDDGAGAAGHGFTFTIGRGNELCVAAIHALMPLVRGLNLDEITADMGRFWHEFTGDSQLRWLGPDKGVIHLAAAAIVNALWDLWAKVEGKPLWKLLTDMPPEVLVRCLDFRFVTDALAPGEALAILHRNQAGRDQREAELCEQGYPAYTTSAGWLGYSDDKIRRLCREGVAAGWTHFKQKVGGDPEADLNRSRVMREEIGWERHLMMDANQVWDVDTAVTAMKRLAAFDPYWIEEPTSPDDVLGHAAIRKRLHDIRVASGEHCPNRVVFKQFFQAEAIDVCQLDCARLGGVNEVLLVLLMAAKFGVPVCPHGGGVGLCEYTQHIAMFDYIAVSASMEHCVLEYVDHLHEHFVDPVVVRAGRYRLPQRPGYSAEIKAESRKQFAYSGAE
jgi:L-fuconate dehydratase